MGIQVGDTVVNTVGLYVLSRWGPVTPDFGAKGCAAYIGENATWTVTDVAESSPDYPGQRILWCHSSRWGYFKIPESALQNQKG